MFIWYNGVTSNTGSRLHDDFQQNSRAEKAFHSNLVRIGKLTKQNGKYFLSALVIKQGEVIFAYNIETPNLYQSKICL